MTWLSIVPVKIASLNLGRSRKKVSQTFSRRKKSSGSWRNSSQVNFDTWFFFNSVSKHSQSSGRKKHCELKSCRSPWSFLLSIGSGERGRFVKIFDFQSPGVFLFDSQYLHFLAQSVSYFGRTLIWGRWSCLNRSKVEDGENVDFWQKNGKCRKV